MVHTHYMFSSYLKDCFSSVFIDKSLLVFSNLKIIKFPSKAFNSYKREKGREGVREGILSMGPGYFVCG